MCIDRWPRAVMTSACCSSSMQMKIPSIPGGTWRPASASARRLVSHCKKSFQSVNSCPSEGPLPEFQTYLDPSRLRLKAIGSATAATMPLPDSDTARA
ncbi:hypothetical protein KCU62_g45, partial [Aureobasidium sp. EXF-3399]